MRWGVVLDSGFDDFRFLGGKESKDFTICLATADCSYSDNIQNGSELRPCGRRKKRVLRHLALIFWRFTPSYQELYSETPFYNALRPIFINSWL